MPITSKTTPNDIEKELERQANAMQDAILYNLKYIGEQVVNHARSLPSPWEKSWNDSERIPPHQPNYIDWTANLRSSIGYIIAIDGNIVVSSDFDGKGAEGAKAGKEYAMEVLRRFPSGIVLIVVAGMRYAKFVQSKGYDVLHSAEDKAEYLVQRMLKQLKLQ